MSAKFTLEGSGSGAVKAVADLNKALEATEKNSEGAVKSTKRLADQAQRITESVNPQEKYNRKMQELAQHVQSGRIKIDDARAAAQKYGSELQRAGQEGDKTWGASALSKVTAMVGAYFTAAAAIREVTSEIQRQAAVKEQAAQKALQSRAGLGSLSQLAAGEGNTKAERKAINDKLIAEARGFVDVGAAADENEAGNLLFQLAGAGLDEKDRAFAAQVRAAGTLTNVGGAAEAYSALKTSLGAKEVGTFREFMSKSLRAAGPAPGSFEQLPIAAAQSGGSAKALGIGDEELLAATTILGKQSGSISEGGTQLSAFLRQVEKAKLRGIEGKGLLGIVETIAAMPERKQGIGGVLGDRAEAVQAFRTLRDNLGGEEGVAALLGKVQSAQAEDLAGEAAGLPSTDAQLGAAIEAAKAQGSLDVSRGKHLSPTRNLFNAAIAARKKQLLENEAGFLATYGLEIIEKRHTQLGTEQSYLETEARTIGKEGGLTGKLAEDIARHVRRSADAAERTEQQGKKRVTTRPE